MANNQVEVVLTGMGRGSCESVFHSNRFLAVAKPDVVISSGLCGALKENLKPGDLIAPRKSRTLRNDMNVDTESVLLELALGDGAILIETLITVDRIIPTVDEKTRLSFFGEAVDMETAIILEHFANASVPVLAVRAISDASDEDLPLDFDRCLTQQGAIKPMNLLNQIVRRPGNISNLVRFGRQSSQAARNLAAFLDKFVTDLPVAIETVAKT